MEQRVLRAITRKPYIPHAVDNTDWLNTAAGSELTVKLLPDLAP